MKPVHEIYYKKKWYQITDVKFDKNDTLIAFTLIEKKLFRTVKKPFIFVGENMTVKDWLSVAKNVTFGVFGIVALDWSSAFESAAEAADAYGKKEAGYYEIKNGKNIANSPSIIGTVVKHGKVYRVRQID